MKMNEKTYLEFQARVRIRCAIEILSQVEPKSDRLADAVRLLFDEHDALKASLNLDLGG